MVSDKDKQDEQTQLPLDTPSPTDDQLVVEPGEEDEGEVLEWTSHPARRRPLVTAAVSVFVVVSGLLMYWSTQSNTFTALTLVILLASLAKFYFPTRYRLTDKGLVVKTQTQKLFKPWSMYRSYYSDKKGILLSPFAGPSRLENFRGLYIMCAENHEEVKAFVKNRIKPDKGASSAETKGPKP